MDNKTFVRRLKELGACQEAIDWVKEHGGTAQECWRDCQRGDWMAWLAGTMDIPLSTKTKGNKSLDRAREKYICAEGEYFYLVGSLWTKYRKTCAKIIRKHIPTIYEDK